MIYFKVIESLEMIRRFTQAGKTLITTSLVYIAMGYLSVVGSGKTSC